jgi:hypothetical protein
MAQDSPAAVLFDSEGNEIAVKDGVIVPANTRGILGYGKDNSGIARNQRFFDLDSGVGIEHVQGVGLRLSESGGSYEAKGQKTMSGSIPVTIADDQSPIPITIGPKNSLTGFSIGTIKLGGGTANTLNAVLATTYNEQIVNAQRSFASSSASDTAAGVGARQVIITYYDSTCAGPFTETVTLNGLAAVATINTNICFIESMIVTSVGTTGRNVGIITLFVNNTGGGGTIGTIGVGNVIATQGDNRTFWSHHYVQPGKTASLATLVASAVVAGAISTCAFILRSRNPTVSTSPDIQISEFLVMSQAVVRALGIPIKVLGPARITTHGIPAGNNNTLFASFDFSEI